MANSKKSINREISHQGAVGDENIIKVSDSGDKAENEKRGGELSLIDVSKIVNSVVDSSFVERNGRIEFAAEYYEVLLAYMEIGAFFPETGVLENGIHLFFLDYIDGKYCGEIEKLKTYRLAQYIENAVERKIEAKIRQIENPLINSLTKLTDAAGALAQKYVYDIDNVGTADIQKFIKDFAKLAKNTNPQTVTEAVIKMHKADTAKASVADETAKAAPKKRTSSKKSAD